MKMRPSIVAACGLLCLAMQASAGSNLLNNAGFESPLGFDFSDPSNWNGFFGGPAGTFLQAFNDTGATPRSGDAALVTTIRGLAGTTNGYDAFTGHVQIVTGIMPGAAYELAVWARTNPSINNGAEMRIEWQNAAGVEISRFNLEIQGGLSSDYQRFAFTELAPAGAARAAVVFAVQSFLNDGTISDTSVAWDDSSLTLIPTPGVVGLVGIAGIAGLRRRR